jgi:hypothetical protein
MFNKFLNIRITVFFSCCLILIPISCSKFPENHNKELSPIQIKSISFTNLTVKSSTTLSGGDIGVFRLHGKGYSSVRSNVRYAASNGRFRVASGETPVYLSKSTAALAAYYPYSQSLSTGIATLTSRLYSSSEDLCYQTGVTASSSNSAVSFVLRHAYAKLVFTIKHNASYTGDCAISRIGISNAGILTSNTLDITDVSPASGSSSSGSEGTYGSGTTGTVTIDPSITSIASGDSTTVNILMVPTVSSLSGKIELSFTVDGNVLTSEIDTDSNPGFTTLEAGKEYDISVDIGKEGTIVSSTANCYMIVPGGSLTISVNVRGNGGAAAGTGLSPSLSPASVGIVWETSRNLITLGSLGGDKTVTLTANSTPSTGGNAVIAAYSGANRTGAVLWSWHIWISDYNPDTGTNGTTYTITNSANASYTFMDRNLGATSATPGDVGAIGLHYQWGRKDPFTASSSFSAQTEINVYDDSGKSFTLLSKEQTVGASNNLQNSIENPEVFYKNDSSPYDWYTSTNNTSSHNNTTLWGGEDLASPSDKTIFDPCPLGWRVPAFKGGQSPWSSLGDNGTDLSSVGTWGNYGVIWTAITAGYWPAAGARCYFNDSLSYVGSSGYYWSASPYSSYGYRLGFNSWLVCPLDSRRVCGFSVRCVKE